MNIDKALSIEGWMLDSELRWLAKNSLNKDVIIEFGSYMGRSTRAICDNTDAFVVAVDPWNGIYYDKDDKLVTFIKPNAYESFRDNLKDHLESGKLEAFRMHSYELPSYLYRTAGLIFIDGDHRYKSVIEDINLARKFVTKGGIIAGHDYTHTADWPGVKQAVDEIYPEAGKTDSIWWIQT